MTSKIIVGPFDHGQRDDRTAFVIDNNSFPQLRNAYQHRGRIKRKRGTRLLTRLKRFFDSNNVSYSASASFNLVAGAGNLITGFTLNTASPNASLVPGSMIITVGANTYTDPGLAGILVGAPGGSGTVNYASGAITISGGAGSAVSGSFLYYPMLPVMGLEEFVVPDSAFPAEIGFDTTFSYNIIATSPHDSYDVSFYKNPAISGSLPGYAPKATETPTTWNGANYQQFWTTNYLGAMWTTNGIAVPFDSTKISMQFAPATTITYVSNTATTIVVTITNCPLIVGDFVFFNEWTSVAAVTPPNSGALNFQSGYVTAAAPNTPTLAAKTLTITLPFANLPADTYIPGIIQYLTNRSNTTKDCIRWYNGDPTNASATAPLLTGHDGWVNFMPPISQSIISIGNLPAAKYYLVGARMIVPFKDRLLFIGVVVQTSSLNAPPIYLQDTIIYSQNGTPYYTASFTENTVGFVTDPTITFHPILVPDNQTATAPAYFSDSTGFGGFVTAGIDQPITTCTTNKDVLILGFSNSQSRLVYTGDDVNPFLFYQITSEFGSDSTFSAIDMGNGVYTKGSKGYIETSQVDSNRIDLEVIDVAFQVDLTNNGNERFTAQRDFINEWIYFTFPSNQIKTNPYPNRTYFFNYRENSWAFFDECYTTYGQFKERTGDTWSTLTWLTWEEWNEPWNSGESTLLTPHIIAGTPQGFVMLRVGETSEDTSISIQSFSGNIVTSPDHGLNNDDYIIISNALGTISTTVNNFIFFVDGVTQNSFRLNVTGTNPIPSGTYLGGGLITRMYKPVIQTKQFPTAWEMARKTRLGAQQYLFTTTDFGQVTVNIFLSQNASTPYNFGGVVPDSSLNNALVYSSILYTCPESTNLGLTPGLVTAPRANLQQITNKGVAGDPVPSLESQTWHRVNTSLLGDTVQIAITLSPAQLADPNLHNQFTEIELHGFILNVSPSGLLA